MSSFLLWLKLQKKSLCCCCQTKMDAQLQEMESYELFEKMMDANITYSLVYAKYKSSKKDLAKKDLRKLIALKKIVAYAKKQSEEAEKKYWEFNPLP